MNNIYSGPQNMLTFLNVVLLLLFMAIKIMLQFLIMILKIYISLFLNIWGPKDIRHELTPKNLDITN